MKALCKLKAAPGLWLQAVDMPKVSRGDVLIKIRKTAICGTDLHIYNWDEWAQKTIRVPMHIGHEFMGEVVEVGEDVHDFNLGDRVSGEGHMTCGSCRNCLAGNRYLCRHCLGLGVHRPGAFAEYLSIPASNAYKIPDDVEDRIASVLDPLGNAVHASLEHDLVGEDVLITGAGPVGLMSIPVVRRAGARHVVITDINPFRLALAEKMGASVAVDPTKTALVDVMKQLKMREGFDVGLEMSGQPDAFRRMLEVMNYGASISFLGVPATDFAIDWHHVVFKALTIKGIYGRRIFETWYKMIGMLQSGLTISPVITHEFSATDFEKAFSTARSGQAGKIILNWG